jgi:hypothetical protein
VFGPPRTAEMLISLERDLEMLQARSCEKGIRLSGLEVC